MGKQVLRNAKIVVNGTDLSDHCSAVEINDAADDVDITGFTGVSYATEAVGFKDVQVICTFFQDYDVGDVHRVLQPLFDAGTAFDINVIPEAALAVGPTNPEFTITVRMFDYSPLDGVIGDAADFEVEFHNASSIGITIGGEEYSILTPTTLLHYSTMMLP